MSFYSSQDVKNMLLEPSVHNAGDRTEFRIHGDVLPSLKLLNAGRFGDATTEVNSLVGALAGIKNIFIYDGRVEITAIRNFNHTMSFKNLMQNNHHNSDIGRFLKRHKVGFQNQYHDDNARYERETIIKNDVVNTMPATDTLTNKVRTYFDLREAFDMLQKVPVLSDKVFKNLRVVLEYTRVAQEAVMNTTNASENCRPLLGVDRVVNPVVASNLVNSLSVVQYEDIESDKVIVPATGGANITAASRKVLGFNGKIVNKLRIRKNFNTVASNLNGQAVRGLGVYESLNCLSEVFQLNINGRPLFPRAGIEGENRRLAMLVDTHGEINLYEDAVQPLHADYPRGQTVFPAGKLDFFCTTIAERVNEFQLDYTRTGKTDTTVPSRYNDALELTLTANVAKVLQIGNGTYQVQYA